MVEVSTRRKELAPRGGEAMNVGGSLHTLSMSRGGRVVKKEGGNGVSR